MSGSFDGARVEPQPQFANPDLWAFDLRPAAGGRATFTDDRGVPYETRARFVIRGADGVWRWSKRAPQEGKGAIR